MLKSLNPKITEEVLYQWRLVRDFKAGEKRVKDMGELYLPRKSGSSKLDYQAYKSRGKVGDYTNQALEVFHGQIMRKQPVVDFQSDNKVFKQILKDFNHEGESFYQFASNVIHDNLQTFFGGILVDMPIASGDIISEHDAETQRMFPYAKYYPAESIIDWGFKYKEGVRKLSFVKLLEQIELFDVDGTNHNIIDQYRVLSLDENDEYIVNVIREEPVYDKNGELVKKDGNVVIEDKIIAAVYPRIKGKRLKEIPFVFAPYKVPETSSLYGIAELHKHYYLQSCDYENGVHMTTLPTGYVTGHIQEKDKQGNPVPIYLGQDIFLEFSEPEAKVGNLQFSGEGMEHCEKAIAQTQEQIGILGTRALSPDKAMSETSDAAKIHRVGENCKLSTYAKNMGEIFTKVLQIMALWLGIDEHVAVQFNTDFDNIAFDPNALNAIANLAREGKYPLPLVFEALKKGEYMPNDMDFREFAMLINLEANGASISEIIDFYQKMRSGEKIETFGDKPVNYINKDIAVQKKDESINED